MAINRKIVVTPFLVMRTALRKIRLNGFVGGLIFGAIFSLVVNITTIQIQEKINQQLYLESLELEIAGHYLDTFTTVNEFNNTTQDLAVPNYFYNPIFYQTRIWDNSEGLRYLVKLDPKVQADLISYYDHIVLGRNKNKELDYEFIREKLKGCYLMDYQNAQEKDKLHCRVDNYEYLKREAKESETMTNISREVLKAFHPTKDRLSNPLMRLLVGNKSVQFLQHE